MSDKIVIIGAGAAGISAGLTLQKLGIPFVILEASERVGGRAYTDKTSLPTHWDQGCSWLHCADVNPLVSWADQLGSVYDTTDRSEKALLWSENKWADAAEQAFVQRGIDRKFADIYIAAKKGHDIPISEIPSSEGIETAIADAMVTLMCSENTKNVSASGYGDYDDTNVNWLLTSGYGDLIAKMAVGLPIQTGIQVSSIANSRNGVRVLTNSNDFDARAAIITVSTNVLRSGQIKFPSGAVQQMLSLVSEVPCGTYEKVAITLDRYPFDPTDNEAIWLSPDREENPIYFQILRGRQPMLIAHIAGQEARDLVGEGPQEMVKFATHNLNKVFGSNIQKLVSGTAVTSWQINPFIQGGYSYAKPGAGKNRHDMIALDTGLITFAGEAFSLPWFGTAHGAYQSGKDVASKLAQRLNSTKSS
ncbi:MAG: NAD(P)/FAD-dependent oxidoreductase, partial [Planktomarina sp.]|nr:NAD(P)/FAD-dependent oxidoreductase [Planktomarina sp.]